MGFTTGLLGGVTLTTATLYLTLHVHRQNRMQQGHLLRQQAGLLNNVVDPPALNAPVVEREAQAGLLEMAKDRWNASLEDNIRRVNTTDWGLVREQCEDVVRASWRTLRSVGQQAKKE